MMSLELCFLHQSATTEADIRHKNVPTGTPAAARGVWQETHAKTDSQTLHKWVSLRYHAGLFYNHGTVFLYSSIILMTLSYLSPFALWLFFFAHFALRGLGDWQFHSWQILRCLTVWFLWDSVSEWLRLRQGKDSDTSLSAGLSVKALQRAGNWAASDFRLLYLSMWLFPTS